ncbi:hypothetical protein DKG77_02060 [Flagellimonas aquimarina]|uniref:Alpha/beta hydrolase n=1 Tax=Flagellimonas aquimarina TaxID=2201895 RepID=A0A316L2L8_9FLAO|nr:hypothetical protein [Allomuricauda koreensis]PWL39638.1 hypothetical protein DKG77_02060 [Allomuricauda koreensis]
MHKKLSFIVLLLMFFGCQDPKNGSLEEPFSNFMGYGEYSVGFKSLFLSDLSREHVPYADWSGKLYPENGTSKGRKLPIHIWYPASEKSKLLPYRHFVNLITKQTQEEFNKESDSLASKIFAYQISELKGDSSFAQDQLDTLLALKTNASLNTLPVQQKFPLILFPNGTSPAIQSVMCEYLASHGYIVAAIALKGQFSHVVDTSTKGLEVAVDDLEFALQQLLELPNIDETQIALLANAIQSSFCVGLASRNKKIKALISLEGGFLSQFEQNILNSTSFYEPQNIAIPILAIYAPHPSISPHHIYHLKYSDRYFAHFPKMSEFHFLNYGLFEEYVPNIIGEPKGNTKKGFKAASELSLSFLNAMLKGKTKKFDQFYTKEIPKEYEITIDTVFKMAGIVPPPNMAILKNVFISDGIDAIESIYQSQIMEGNPTPFSMTFYNDFKNWLAWKKDPEYTNRLRLYKMAVKSYPNSALNNYRLAFYLDKNNADKASHSYYLKASQLLDKDSTLTQSQVADLKNAIVQALQ